MKKGQKVSTGRLGLTPERSLYDWFWSLFWNFPLQIVCDVVATVPVQPNGHSPAICGFCFLVPSFEDQFVNIIGFTLIVVHSVVLFVS